MSEGRQKQRDLARMQGRFSISAPTPNKHGHCETRRSSTCGFSDICLAVACPSRALKRNATNVHREEKRRHLGYFQIQKWNNNSQQIKAWLALSEPPPPKSSRQLQSDANPPEPGGGLFWRQVRLMGSPQRVQAARAVTEGVWGWATHTL